MKSQAKKLNQAAHTEVEGGQKKASSEKTRSESNSEPLDFSLAKALDDEFGRGREERVQALKRQLAEGSYKIDSEAVATAVGKMINEEVFFEKSLLKEE